MQAVEIQTVSVALSVLQPMVVRVRAAVGHDDVVLQVLCDEAELGAGPHVLSVGDRVERQAVRRRWTGYGTDLDLVEWEFRSWSAGQEDEVRVWRGVIVELAAVYVVMTARNVGFFHADRGSARLVSVSSTAETVRPARRVRWGAPESALVSGARAGVGEWVEGDEHLEGWVVTLEA